MEPVRRQGGDLLQGSWLLEEVGGPGDDPSRTGRTLLRSAGLSQSEAAVTVRVRESRRGDPNDSGSMDLSDAIFLFSFLFMGGDAPGCLEAADVNNSWDIDISDGIALLNFLFLVAPPPAAPGHEACGPDPDLPGSEGDLTCRAYTSC